MLDIYLQEFSLVMVRGCRVRDVPGMHYKIIRGNMIFFTLKNLIENIGDLNFYSK